MDGTTMATLTADEYLKVGSWRNVQSCIQPLVNSYTIALRPFMLCLNSRWKKHEYTISSRLTLYAWLVHIATCGAEDWQLDWK